MNKDLSNNIGKNRSRERNPKVTTQATTHKAAHSEGSNPLRLALTLAAVLVALVAMILVTEREARAALTEKIVFDSNRTTGTGVNNPTGDYEIFKMNPDGTGVKQLTTNKIDDYRATLSPGGKKIVYVSYGKQTSNPQGDEEVYAMDALDGKEKKNLSNTGAGVSDDYPAFSPDGRSVAYESYGKQTSNSQGDEEVYHVNVLDGTGKRNLTNNGADIEDSTPRLYPRRQEDRLQSYGKQTSNPEGDEEVYVINADGSGQKNLTNNGAEVNDDYPVFSPGGKEIAYVSRGVQTSNPEGDHEVYVMSALDGSGQTNLTYNDDGVFDYEADFSPNGTKIVYQSYGVQTSNPEGDQEVYVINALVESGEKNLTNNGTDVHDFAPDWGRQAT